jgi:hypothetical protein
VAMARMAGLGHLAGGHLQGGKQGGGAVPEVVVGAPRWPAGSHRAGWLGALQRLDLGLLVHAQHDRVCRRVKVQPDHVADLGLQLRVGGELERLGLPGFDVVLGPDPGDCAVADVQLVGQQSRGPMGHAQVFRGWGQGGGQDLRAPGSAHRLGAATGREIPSRSVISVLVTPRPPAAGAWPADKCRGRLGRAGPVTQDSPVVWGDGQGGGRRWHAPMLPHLPQPSNQLRDRPSTQRQATRRG